MLLRETPEALAWLRRFDHPDRETAIFLLDSLRLVSSNRFFGEVRRSAMRLVSDVDPPFAVYAVREVDEDEVYFEHKGRRPNAVRPGKEVGSEGALAYVATNLCRSNPQRFLNHPPLTTLRSKSCHNVILLDDLSGSGNRVVEFLASMRRNKTVVSWCSYGLLRFHLVAYAVSEQAEEAIRAVYGRRKGTRPLIDISFRFARRASAGPDRWSSADSERVRKLCEEYGKRGKIRWNDRNGHRDSMTTIVFAHGCPNNAPGILWCATDAWQPLFPNRAVPDSLVATAFEPSVSATSVRSASGPAPSSPFTAGVGPDDPLRFDVPRLLDLLRRRVRGLDRLAEILDISTNRCADVLKVCQAYQLIDLDGHLTDAGRAELRRAERLGTLGEDDPPLRGAFYFPKQLRKAKGTI